MQISGLKVIFSNRSQYVKYDCWESSSLNISCGVPQGSILGPKLFILYINDLCNISKLFKYILFADDTNLFCSGKDIAQLSNAVNTELCKLKLWFAANKLSLNISKTQFMLFSRSKCIPNFQLFIDDKQLDRVKSTKFLGVIIDEKLCWAEQIAKVKSKVSRNISLLYKVRSVMDKTT